MSDADDDLLIPLDEKQLADLKEHQENCDGECNICPRLRVVVVPPGYKAPFIFGGMSLEEITKGLDGSKKGEA